ncbi:serine/threonine protein kinase [Marinicella meishanensis]|uniref:serine/threonine protein kinase n=1 Tax=Marinicella meishanensis TaxID=2873263 RepID=UPI001CBC3F89|nr:serine/threonine-protein kinase [Marinicella sp. NBU2979]
MDSNRYKQLKSLFHQAAELPEAQVMNFLQAHCADQAMFDQIIRMLKTEHESMQATEQVVQEASDTVIKSAVFFPDDRYILIKSLGHGGMGQVFLAKRNVDHIEHLVALKILQLTDPAAQRRFLRESEILSRMSHPNISQFIDSDILPDGRPYVVMEYIEGLSITAFSETRDLRSKLDLFLQLCEAVKHAHRNLIIHQDLKPDNILVTKQGQVKLLDFGIAKILQQNNQHTQTLLRALTPGYASPEQLLGQPIDVTSDVYSLGMVLYQLLSGTLPYSLDGLKPLEIHQLLQDQIIDPPSKAKTASHTKIKVNADLDAITLKALAFDPDDRYGSVDDLTHDLHLYQKKAPISARKIGALYRSQKYIQRHKIDLSIVAAFLFFAWLYFNTLINKNQAIESQLATIVQQRDDLLLEQKRAEYIADSFAVERHADTKNNGNQATVVNEMINAVNGNMFYAYELDLLDNPIKFVLYYNTKSAQQTRGLIPLNQVGKGWTHSYIRQLTVRRYASRDDFHLITADRPDGEAIAFEKIESQWTNSKGYDIEITKQNDQWTLINQQNEQEHYGWFGELLGTATSNQYLTIEWEHIYPEVDKSVGRYQNDKRIKSILADTGHAINFHYQHDKTMVVDFISDEKGRIWQFEYDLHYNLVAVTNPDGTGKTFRYEDEFRPYNMTAVGTQLYDGFSVIHKSFDYHDISDNVKQIGYHSQACENDWINVDYCCGATTLSNQQGQSNVYKINKQTMPWSITTAELEFEFPQCNFDLFQTWRNELLELTR